MMAFIISELLLECYELYIDSNSELRVEFRFDHLVFRLIVVKL